jgi:hypothetical protein
MTARILKAVLLTAVVACSLAAQGAPGAPASVTRWNPYLGCWSTSSRGEVGPMVCVVPTTSVDRVEFMTVDGDTVFARTMVDASGTPQPMLRGDCAGWESATWSHDGQRLFMHADYACAKGRTLRSDAILSMTRSDAFTHLERRTNSDTAEVRAMHFIVQLDTTVFPAEVRQRLTSYRPLAVSDSELVTVPPVAASDVLEAATMLDPKVVQAWLADRGDSTDLSTTDLRVLRVASEGNLRSDWRALAGVRWGRRSTSSVDFPAAFRTGDIDWGGEPTAGRMLTPATVGWGQAYPGYQSGFTWHGWP